jgi:hypothetical protein
MRIPRSPDVMHRVAVLLEDVRDGTCYADVTEPSHCFHRAFLMQQKFRNVNFREEIDDSSHESLTHR